MGKDDWPRQRVAELSPDEDIIHVVSCDHGKSNSGWLVVTEGRVWWVNKGGFFGGGASEEMSLSNSISVEGIAFSRKAVLRIGGEQFQMKKDQAEEASRIIRTARS
jgi:hypothetical protein